VRHHNFYRYLCFCISDYSNQEVKYYILVKIEMVNGEITIIKLINVLLNNDEQKFDLDFRHSLP